MAHESDVYYDGYYITADGRRAECRLLSDERDCVAVVCYRAFRYRIVFDAAQGRYMVKVDAVLDMDDAREQL